MNTKKTNFDFSTALSSIEKVKAMNAPKERKTSVSLKPLTIDPDPEDSPLKSEIVRIVNERNLTYGDIYAYCTKIKDGDPLEGQKFGYNLITGLRKRHTMIDTTFTLLADFLGLEIHLVPKPETEELTDIDEVASGEQAD